MDANLLARAQTEIEISDQALVGLGATKHFGEIERCWTDFLVHFDRIFKRLEAAAGGKGDAWFGRIEQFRKKDALLSYLHHARNVDEHGLISVTKREPGLIREMGAEHVDPARPEAGMNVILEVRNPHVALVDVIDRAVKYTVPTSFRENAISKAHPLNVGLLGLSYAEGVVIEARGMLRS
jgi:hypothetical protein